MTISLYQGDCLVEMDRIPDGSVDCIIADLPYQLTACHWDQIIPFEPLWTQYKRVIKKNGAIVLFGSQPFTSALVMSNPTWFRYEWIWDKRTPTGHLNAKRMPLKSHENILVFSESQGIYNPQLDKRSSINHSFGDPSGHNYLGQKSPCSIYGEITKDRDWKHANSGMQYPKSIRTFPTGNGWTKRKNVHPTQKPVAVLEYLIRTYTNEGETVMDNCFGSGSCGVAAVNTGRHFIGIEKDPDYFKIAQPRINAAIQPLPKAA